LHTLFAKWSIFGIKILAPGDGEVVRKSKKLLAFAWKSNKIKDDS